MTPDKITTTQEVANRILCWLAAGKPGAKPKPAKFMAGVILFGPRFEQYDAMQPVPNELLAFLPCLDLVDAVGLDRAGDDLNQLRLVSPAWNAVMDAWDVLKAVAHANKHLAAGQPHRTFLEKEDMYVDAFHRHRLSAPLSWTVPVPERDEKKLAGACARQKLSVLGQEMDVLSYPKHVLPPDCVGVYRPDQGRGFYVMVDPAVARKSP